MRRCAGAALAVLLAVAAPAAAQDSLLGIYGAWVVGNEECGRIFANENGRVVFGAEGRGPLPGFIINATGISNNEYICSVREYTVRQADVTFTGRCEFGRRTRRQRFAMRELNGRFQIELSRGAFVPVKRCAPDDLKDLAALKAERARIEQDNVSAFERARGFWASTAEACARAFVADAQGRYAIAPTLPASDVAVILSANRFMTRGSVCASPQLASSQQPRREFQANYLCSADGREFPTTERVTIIDPNTIERTPASRNPMPQRLVRCTPPDWEKALQQ